MRFRLALTEDEPTVKPYDESRWAELPDARLLPPEISLQLLEALHQRWVSLLRSLSPQDFIRRIRHPEIGVISLDCLTGLYSWHSRHHIAQIEGLRRRMGW